MSTLSSGDRLGIKLLSALSTQATNGEKQIYSDGLEFKMDCMMWDIFDGGVSSDWPKYEFQCLIENFVDFFPVCFH